MPSRACPDGPLKGSRLQLRSYLYENTHVLGEELLRVLNVAGAGFSKFDWVSPIKSAAFAEYRDEEFLRQLGLGTLAPQLGTFWPENGPCWDGLARAHSQITAETRGVILVEAKSHRLEVCGSGCGATAPGSKQKIDSAIKETKTWLGVRPSAPWTSHLYQYANRLAHLYFFRCVAEPRIDAWLVNVYFTHDPYRPTSMEQWDDFLPDVKWALGLEQTAPYSVDLFLPAIAPA